MTADPGLPDAVRAALAAAGDPERARGAQAYMKSAMPFHGVPVPEVPRIALAALAAHPLGPARRPTGPSSPSASTRTSAIDRAFFIRKAIGWALRDLARADPGWVTAFVEAAGDRLSPLSRREATKHLPAFQGAPVVGGG